MSDDRSPDTLLRSARAIGEHYVPDHPYFAHAEPSMDQVWEALIWPMIRSCDLGYVVDLAAGHGRNTRKVLEAGAQRVLALDIQPGNVAICADRFAGDPRLTCAVCSGYDMAPAPSRAVGLVYCFDAMVHFNPDVVGSYLAETRRCLKPGGHGFFHHSNHLGGPDWQANPHARNVMSAALFRGFAAAARLEVVEQRVIDWGDAPGLDCVTLVRKGA